MGKRSARELGKLDAHAQAQLLRQGDCTAMELTEAAISRIEQLDGELNSLSVLSFDIARARAAKQVANSGLGGVPYLLKDSLDYPGMPTAYGSRVLAGRPPITKAWPYVQRLDELGLIPLGKTNVPEFSLLPTTESVHFGSARNPWSLAHSPGGSSGGSGVAVAAGLVPLAQAADGGGSIRIPASCCGLIGLKATRGSQLRARPAHFIEDLLTADGLLARTVRDAAWGYSSLRSATGTEVSSPVAGAKPGSLRIGVVELNLFNEQPHPEVSDVLGRAADLCSRLGHDVRRVKPPIDGPPVAQAFRTIWTYLGGEIVAHCRTLVGERADSMLENWTLGLSRAAAALTSHDDEQVYLQVGAATGALDRWFSSFDVMLTPVLNEPTAPIGRYDPQMPFEMLYETMFRYVAYTPLQNLTGHPALSLPLFHGTGGLPVGSMFTAAKGREDLLFALAAQLEEALPWADRWPPHSIGGVG